MRQPAVDRGDATSADTGRAPAALGVAREVVIVGFAAAVYGAVRDVTEGSVAQAVANAQAVERLERTLGSAGSSRCSAARGARRRGPGPLDPRTDPGGAGTQQVLLVYALQQTASTAAALSFSVGMQVGITTVNTIRAARRTTSI